MLRIALITEGFTDQIALEQIILGVLGHLEDEPEINFVSPDIDETERLGRAAPGGWTLVFRTLEEGDVLDALDFNDIVVVHIDTDVCEEIGFDVPRKKEGVERSPSELVQAVGERLKNAMRASGLEDTELTRVVLAIPVNAIECWLMPLFFPSNKGKRSKVVGCLEEANRHLKSKGLQPLSTSKGKNGRAYQAAFKPFQKPRTLNSADKHSESLSLFLVGLRESLASLNTLD